MNRKGQAAMEFLMTYGWAIIIVLAAIGALAYFGVLSPQKLLPDRTTFQAPLANVDNAVITMAPHAVAIAFKNNKGVSITLPLTARVTPGTGVTCTNVNLTGISGTGASAVTIVANTTQIANGGSFILTFTCSDGPTAGATIGTKFKADFSFDYTNVETGQTIKQTGSVEGKYS